MENSILIEEPPREGCTGKVHAELSLDKVVQLLAHILKQNHPNGHWPGLSRDHQVAIPSEDITKFLGLTGSVTLKVLSPTCHVLSPGSLCCKWLLVKHEATWRDAPFMGPQNHMQLVTGGSSNAHENK